MSAVPSKFALLLDLAKETSSDKRRDLLREITSVLAADARTQTDATLAAFDDIAVAVIADLKSQARAELSRMLADAALPLGRTARELALDEIEVARPVLEQSTALTDGDLIEVASSRSQEHLLAMTRRSAIAERVSDALVAHGEDRVVASLLVNKGAQIGQETFEKVAERAQGSEILQAPLVRRQDVPLELLDSIYASVAAELRQEIVKTYEKVSPAELEAALERSRKRVNRAYGGLPADFESAKLEFRRLERDGKLEPLFLVTLMREGAQSRTLFMLVLARLTDSTFQVVQRIIETRDIDALALLCRGAGFPRPLFVTLSLLVLNEEAGGSGKLEEFGRLYEQVPLAAAQRAVRFWKVRGSG
jgi:uncharacterized protein (DUF2336 family)